jgi:hypothetical protein
VSILYEALQKTQEEGYGQSMVLPQDDMTRDDWIDVTISLVIAFLLATLIVAHYPQFNNKSEMITMNKTDLIENSYTIVQPDKTAAPPSIASVAEKSNQIEHTLNGVFVSGDEKIAMVDNRFFSIGDNIDDMTIVSIEQDNIKLKSNSGMVELHLAV